MKEITLYVINRYKDGGSYSLIDSEGKKYHQNNKFGDNPNKGVVFEGDINNENPKIAKGNFVIDLTEWYELVQKLNKNILPEDEYPRLLVIKQF